MNRYARASLFTLPIAVALLAPARADELFVGSPTTLIQSGNPFSGAFTTIGACGGAAQSMTLDGSRLLIGDPSGRVYQKGPSDSFVNFAFNVPNDAQALAMHGGNLLVGGTDGTLVRVDATTGAVIATLQVGAPVTALLVMGNDVFAGTSFGIVEKGDAIAGNFQFWGTCGGPVNALAADSTHLILGSSNGNIYRVNLLTQMLEGTFPAGNDSEALVVQADDIVVGGSDGSLRRLERMTGALKGSFSASVPVSSLALLIEPQPGLIYCYGGGCPCGNDDGTAGCAHSLGWGGRLLGSGSTSVAADDLAITAFNMPPNRFARFYMSQHSTMVPLGDGLLCAGGGGSGYPAMRFPVQNTGISGSIAMPEHLVGYVLAHFPSSAIIAGATWNMQTWYRDPPGPCGNRFNTTNSYAVTFTP
ncbi:MAG TPA: hypothetical protein VGR31_14335 [Planctomycetota bacterium]|jgi:hypothetical protein|nr:hypothetical protein [Planctomycetota bacterium]